MSTARKALKSPRSLAALVAFIGIVVAVGAAIGTQTLPGGWYEGLAKPPFNPPNWVFGPVWFTLYVMIAVAGWRIFERAPKSAAMILWGTQMVLNWIWSPVFFLGQNLVLALVIILAMLGAIFAFMVSAHRHDPVATWLFAPYAAWVSFAMVLNASLVVLN